MYSVRKINLFLYVEGWELSYNNIRTYIYTKGNAGGI